MNHNKKGAFTSVLATEYTECWPCPLFDICSISNSLLASLLAGRKPQCTPGADYLRMYLPIHWNIKSSPASPGRSRVGPALYVLSLLDFSLPSPRVLYKCTRTYCTDSVATSSSLRRKESFTSVHGHTSTDPPATSSKSEVSECSA